MKRLTTVDSFIDNSIPDIEERLAMWAHDVFAFTEMWQLVLESKWTLASIAQGQIQTEVEDNEESDNVGC